MKALKNDVLLRALLKKPVDYTPVWLMRQAGRYLPEYRALRKKTGDFLSLCKDKSLACEVALQPLKRFNLDAAILFSDILTIPDAMGLGLFFETGEGPRFKHPIRTAADINALPMLNVNQDLSYVLEAVRLTRNELNGSVPLIGFSGSPWTLATYMIEGGSSRDFRYTKEMLYQQPEILHQLLQYLTDIIVDYLNAQIKNGAQIIQIFDTWGGILSFESYPLFSLQYIKNIMSRLMTSSESLPVPVILFSRQSAQLLDMMALSGATGIGLDWTFPIQKAYHQIGKHVALQGNIDPAVLYGSNQVIQQEVTKLLHNYYTASGIKTGYVFNLGHGVPQYVNPDKVRLLIDTVHEQSVHFNIR
ncbi:MAG: uroporphyrinogen decarboxylase [Endozoicomonadaceae bacterium]|nr:uroporphyrinogen decarboxylase [Endozoicomonadaceae bacterium]